MDRLLQLLSTNSGFTTDEIATMLGEPEDYIKAQIKEYETQGIIKGYQAVVNWENTKENYVEALIELKVTPKKDAGFDEMAKMCMAFDEVDSVYLMAGTYDFALIVRANLCRISQCLYLKNSPQSTECFQQAHISLCVATKTAE